MNSMQRLLGRIFPLMAISGLLLAGWGLIVTPDDMKSDAQGALLGSRSSSTLALEAMSPNN